MVSLTEAMVALGCGCVFAGGVRAQDMPNPQQVQTQVQNIVRERPREAEAAARAFLHVIGMKASALDSLKTRSLDEYWMEVGQLTVQFDMVQQLARRDSARAELVTRMFGLEVNARGLQRVYKNALEPQRATLRRQLEGLIDQHFDIENQLRGLEIADIERRLSQVRAETERRREKRAEFVKWAVDDIIRDATRPQ